MSLFVPVSTAFEDGVNAPRAAVRNVKLLIDGDGDGTFSDYTSYIDFGAGGIAGGGKRGGRLGEAMSNAWSVTLRNQHLELSAGDLAEAPAAVEVDVDGVGYVRISRFSRTTTEADTSAPDFLNVKRGKPTIAAILA